MAPLLVIGKVPPAGRNRELIPAAVKLWLSLINGPGNDLSNSKPSAVRVALHHAALDPCQSSRSCIMRRITGVVITCMANPILPAGTTMVSGADMKEPLSI